MTVGIVATLKAQEGKESEFEAVFRELAAAVRANEPGNKLYSVFRSRKDKGTYIVMEMYENEDAVQAHRKADHFRAAGPKIGAALAGAPDVAYFDAI
ncbi:MAG: putative quinol monooxygenase [Rhizomicrobium sp.]|jgi:quinol monooxygenase YgiN